MTGPVLLPTRRPVLHNIPAQVALSLRRGSPLRYRGESFLDGQILGLDFDGARETLWCEVAPGLAARSLLWPDDTFGRLVLARWILADATGDPAGLGLAPRFASEVVAGLCPRYWSLTLAEVDSWILTRVPQSSSLAGGV